jgi:hypothetical protein
MEKIKGWVAWHPEAGIMIDDTQNCYSPDGFFVGLQQKSIYLIRCREADGWQIREVELRFTDEEQKP